jgi:hypothetical protein
MNKTLLGLFVLCAAATAQPLGIGVKLGVPATDAFDVIPVPTFTPFTADQRQFVFGPYLELRLPANLAIEIDALHRSYEFRNAQGGETATAWEFPVLVKHRFGSGLIRPYFDVGASFSRLSDIRLQTLKHQSNYGLVVGGGFDINALLFKISPEIRYTGWGFKNFDGPAVDSKRNQLLVLFGIGF